MRVLWRPLEGFDWKMLIFCPRSQFLAGSSHAPAIFSEKSARDWSLIMRFWTAGFTACPPDIQIGQLSSVGFGEILLNLVSLWEIEPRGGEFAGGGLRVPTLRPMAGAW